LVTGFCTGTLLGMILGINDGHWLGDKLGIVDGEWVGRKDGLIVGYKVGAFPEKSRGRDNKEMTKERLFWIKGIFIGRILLINYYYCYYIMMRISYSYLSSIKRNHHQNNEQVTKINQTIILIQENKEVFRN
jgi:hypothetical protein